MSKVLSFISSPVIASFFTIFILYFTLFGLSSTWTITVGTLFIVVIYVFTYSLSIGLVNVIVPFAFTCVCISIKSCISILYPSGAAVSLIYILSKSLSNSLTLYDNVFEYPFCSVTSSPFNVDLSLS